MAGDLERVWSQPRCPTELKKNIVRTAIKEIIVSMIPDSERLRFVMHWSGGVHTEFEIAKAKLYQIRPTSAQAVEIIARMAERYGDDHIAGVLNRLGHRTGKGNPWTQQRVGDVRSSHSIPG